MTPREIRKAVDAGRISQEQGARMLELVYDFRRIARRARLKRWLLDCLPWRWFR